jgi:hypothetical protein
MPGPTTRTDTGRTTAPGGGPRTGRATTWRRTGTLTLALGCAAAVLVLAACSASGDDRGDQTAADRPAGVEGEAGDTEDLDVSQDAWSNDERDGGGAGAGFDDAEPDEATEDADRDVTVENLDGTPVQTVSARTGRRVVRTARLELDVEDAGLAADRIATIAADAGGFIAETDLEREADGTVRGSMTLRVPSTALFATVEELDALAVAVPVRRIDERDVTSESTDLRARLTNLTAYEIELRALLSDVRETTTRPEDLLTVFERIRSVRAEIDQAEARLAVLDDQVALSTISVSLRPATSAVPVVDPTWAPSETVREALTTTARALSGIADVAIRLTLTVLPISLLLGAPVIVAAAVWRRVRGARPTPAPAGPVT